MVATVIKQASTGTAFFVLIALTGCATPAQPERMVPRQLAAQTLDPASMLRGAIFLAKVGGGEETNPALVSKVGSKELEEALRSSLDQYGALSAAGTAAFELEVFLIELKQQAAGFRMTVDSFVRYKLTRTRDRKVMMDEIVTASHQATVDDALYGPRRLRLANEGAMRANIAAFLEKLELLDLARPVVY